MNQERRSDTAERANTAAQRLPFWWLRSLRGRPRGHGLCRISMSQVGTHLYAEVRGEREIMIVAALPFVRSHGSRMAVQHPLP